MQKSNKPTRDLAKVITDPLVALERQLKMMMKGNEKFFQILNNRPNDDVQTRVLCRDARNVPIDNGEASLVVTSPPYVTSYEYADLHQLTALWLDYTDNLSEFRKKFIGTSYYEHINDNVNSNIGDKIIADLQAVDKRTSLEVKKYFVDINQVFIEMHRYLKRGGVCAVVIGNTKLKGVGITNAEVFYQQLENIGFKEKEIIKREIPSKLLPSTRDESTGRFAKASNANKVFAYPTAYILIMEKK